MANQMKLLFPTLALLTGLGAAALRPAGAAAAPGRPSASDVEGCMETPAPVRPHREPSCTEAPAPAHLRSKLFHQLRYHSTFPATRAELITSFRSAAELSPEELSWIADRLPAGRLTSAAATMSRLFPDAPASVLARVADGPGAQLASLATR